MEIKKGQFYIVIACSDEQDAQYFHHGAKDAAIRGIVRGERNVSMVYEAHYDREASAWPTIENADVVAQAEKFRVIRDQLWTNAQFNSGLFVGALCAAMIRQLQIPGPNGESPDDA